MPGTNWVQLLNQARQAITTINKIKGMVNGLNDLNFSSLMSQVGLDSLSQLSSLANVSDSMLSGLATLSSLPSMNPAQLSTISEITGVAQDVLQQVSQGILPEGFDSNQLNELVNSMSTVSGLSQTIEHLSGVATGAGKAELTPELVQQALVAAGGSLPGLPSPMGTTLADATALLNTIQGVQQKLGGSLNSVGSAISGLFPSNDLSFDNISPDVWNSVGVDPASVASEINSLLTGSQSALSSLSSSSQMLGSLTGTQLFDLTSGIYNIQNIQARINRVVNFQTQITGMLSQIGISGFTI